jgi:hypothetical protein
MSGRQAQLREPYRYRDPATGQVRIRWRVPHDLTRSLRLEAYRECVAEDLSGRRYRGLGSPAADERAVHAAFSLAARRCARKAKQHPSDRRRQ